MTNVDPGLATIVIALLAFLGTIITAYLSFRAQMLLEQNRQRIDANFATAQVARHQLNGKVEELHVSMNSRLTQLLEEVARASRLEGRLLGIAEEMARSTAAAQDLVRNAAAVLETKKEDLS